MAASLSRRALGDYDGRLSEVERAARDCVFSRVSAYLERFPEASVAAAREFAKEVIGQAVEAYGDAASSLAADLYDELAEAAGERLPAAEVDGSDVSRYVDDAVRYQAGKLAQGQAQAFVQGCASCASDQVSRRANATMARNASRDGLRWARVPMGGETCTFCAMLALSRVRVPERRDGGAGGRTGTATAAARSCPRPRRWRATTRRSGGPSGGATRR